jgi:hypothetical protein
MHLTKTLELFYNRQLLNDHILQSHILINPVNLWDSTQWNHKVMYTYCILPHCKMFCCWAYGVCARPEHVAVSKQVLVVFNGFVFEWFAVQLTENSRHREVTLCWQVNIFLRFEKIALPGASSNVLSKRP